MHERDDNVHGKGVKCVIGVRSSLCQIAMVRSRNYMSSLVNPLETSPPPSVPYSQSVRAVWVRHLTPQSAPLRCD